MLELEREEEVLEEVNLTYFSSLLGSQDKEGTTAVLMSTVLHFTLNHILVLLPYGLWCQLIIV